MLLHLLQHRMHLLELGRHAVAVQLHLLRQGTSLTRSPPTSDAGKAATHRQKFACHIKSAVPQQLVNDHFIHLRRVQPRGRHHFVQVAVQGLHRQRSLLNTLNTSVYMRCTLSMAFPILLSSFCRLLKLSDKANTKQTPVSPGTAFQPYHTLS